MDVDDHQSKTKFQRSFPPAARLRQIREARRKTDPSREKRN